MSVKKACHVVEYPSPVMFALCTILHCFTIRSDRVGLLSAQFRHRLTVSTFGFASGDQDFSVLEAMAEAARSAGAKGDFLRPELSSAGLRSAIASAVSTLTDTKSQLSSTLMAPPVARGRRALPPIRELQKESAECEHPDGWVVYVRGVMRWEYAPVSWIDKRAWRQMRLMSPAADGIAIRKVPFGEGAERVVFKMQVSLAVRTHMYLHGTKLQKKRVLETAVVL